MNQWLIAFLILWHGTGALVVANNAIQAWRESKVRPK